MTPEREKELKQEFARVFNWFEHKQIGSFYANSKLVPMTPSWEQIFVELGRLQERASQPPGRSYLIQEPTSGLELKDK